MDAPHRDLLYFQPAQEAPLLIPQLTAERWTVHTARTCAEAALLARRHDIGVGLTPLPDAGSCERAAQLCHVGDALEWIALVQPRGVERASLREVIAQHFFDYHTIPADLQRLLFSLGHAHGMARVQRGADHDRPDPFEDYEMVGTSEVMLEHFRTVRKIASVDAPVLINGESGTGKELTARAIHERSRRAKGPFIPVNCGALPSTLIQAELFGHEKGAFTGAHQRKIGFIEAAAGGTLFLDEIGDLPLDLQANLLRFLQEHVIQRVGGRRSIAVDVRVVAATHTDLAKAVEAGRFREDLYYRLNVLHVTLPALRERTHDIEVLANFFFHKFASEKRGKLKGFSSKALEAMQSYDWPGNVRELINRVRRAIVMTDKRLLSAEDLGLSGARTSQHIVSLDQVRCDAEQQAIRHTLRCTRNNVSKAAKYLGVSRMTLYRMMEKYGIAQ